MHCLLITAIIISLSVGTANADHEADSFRFERDGFIIHYVGNGGNCDECEWIAISGPIPGDADELFNDFIKANLLTEYTLDIRLNGDGGSTRGAMGLGRVLRKRGHATIISKTVHDGPYYGYEAGSCSNACAWAFLGGKSRWIEEGNFAITLAPPDKDLVLQADLLAYILDMGIAPQLLIKTAQTVGSPPPDVIASN